MEIINKFSLAPTMGNCCYDMKNFLTFKYKFKHFVKGLYPLPAILEIYYFIDEHCNLSEHQIRIFRVYSPLNFSNIERITNQRQ